MGNIIGNSIAGGGPTYTGGQCLRCNAFWSSPLAIVWRIFYAVISASWLIARIFISLVINVVRAFASLVIAWKVILMWIIVLVAMFIVWFIWPPYAEKAQDIFRFLLNVLPTAVAWVNLWIDMYNILALTWNMLYPFVGFFLYVWLDIVIATIFEFLKIMGEPAIGQLLFLLLPRIVSLMQMALAVGLPFLRYLPFVTTALSAQLGPIVQVVMDVVPYIFPMVSWLLGLLFFLLEPILALVVWAVKKVESFFNRRTARSLLSLGMSGMLLTRDMLMAIPSGGSGSAVAWHLQQQQLDAALANATAAEYEGQAWSVRQLLQAPQFQEPAHERPDVGGAPQPGVSVEENGFWRDVGTLGSKYWSDEFSLTAARRELGGITSFLHKHPHASFEYMAAEQNHWMQHELYMKQESLVPSGGGGDGGDGTQFDKSMYGTRNTLGLEPGDADANATTHTPWFAGSGDLESSLLLEALQRECDTTPWAAHCRLHDEDGVPRGPATMPHHYHVRVATALGTPPHLQSASVLDPHDIERRHAALVEEHGRENFHRVRTAIEQDIANGDHIECGGSPICGGAGAKMAHPVYTIKQRWDQFANIGADRHRAAGDDHEQMRQAKVRHILTDAAQHATNAGLHRLNTVHVDGMADTISHHGSVMLAKTTGLNSMADAVEHYNTHYSSFQEVHHHINRALSSRPWFHALREADPHRETRQFYDEWTERQTFHLRMERDATHGHMRPKLYVEMEHAPAARQPLYTLELFSFLNDLDCYTTNPRAPLCLPDPFPDNWHISASSFPATEFMESFIETNDPRCFCSQYFCEPLRKWDHVFPWLRTKNTEYWPIHPVYVFSPCAWYNVLAYPLIVAQWIWRWAFLRLASYLLRYWWLRPFLQWVFIIPAGRTPPKRILFCMVGNVWWLGATAFLFWVFGLVGKPLWDAFVQGVLQIRTWFGTQMTYLESYWAHIESSNEGVLYAEAYDSNLNWGQRMYNDPTLVYRDSLGVPRPAYPWHGAQMDQLSPGGAAPNFAQQQALYGVGNGRIPYMDGLPDGTRTRYERARVDNQHRLNAYDELRPAPDLTTPYNDVVQPELSMLGAGIDDVCADSGPANEVRRHCARQAALSQLIASRERAIETFGVSPLPMYSHVYDAWRRLFGWLLLSHHFSDHFQRQVYEQQLRTRQKYERMPWIGPAHQRRRDVK